MGRYQHYIGAAGFNNSSAVSIAHSIYKKRTTDIGLIKNVPKKLKEMLKENFSPGIFPPVASELSADGTIKYLFRTDVTEKCLNQSIFLIIKEILSVYPHSQDAGWVARSVLTAGYGFHGDLTAGEIVNQVYQYTRMRIR